MKAGCGYPQMLDVALLAEQPFELLILLVFGHFLADFPLQSDRMAVEKCPGKDAVLDWRWWLAAHSATHGLLWLFSREFHSQGLAEMFFML